MDARYEKFLKPTGGSRKRTFEGELGLDHTPAADKDDREPPTPGSSTEAINPDAVLSLYAAFRAHGNKSWLEQDNPTARDNFNRVNIALHPKRKPVEGIAVSVLKGTSFPDKRKHCVAEAIALAAGESTGEVLLIPEPENPYDPHALAVVSRRSGEHLGYIPRAAEANRHYIGSIAEGRFAGGYIIEAKRSKFKDEDSAMLFVATGWHPAE